MVLLQTKNIGIFVHDIGILKRNVSLTEEEVKSGKYGNIIPEDAKVVPPGANIFEFKGKNIKIKMGSIKHIIQDF